MTPEQRKLTWFQTNHLDFADIYAWFDLDLDGTLGHLLVGKVDQYSVLAWRFGFVLYFERAILVVCRRDRHIHALLISQTNSDIA